MVVKNVFTLKQKRLIGNVAGVVAEGLGEGKKKKGGGGDEIK